jgi:predicted acyl esterase
MKKLALYVIAFFLIGFTAKLAPTPSHAQQASTLKSSYTKSEHTILMRDGVKLFVAVYSPKDTSQKYPIILNRTPYSCGPYGPNDYKETIGPSPLFAQEGYIIVYQDVRGAWMSEGTYVNMRPQNDHKTKPTDIDESAILTTPLIGS